MYGHIHVVIRDLVLESFGSDAWDKILEEAKFNEGEHFLQFDYFTDAMTVQLITAVSKCLDLPLPDVLETFGDFFLKHCLRHGYDNMLRTLGRDMKSFIQNLDSLHSLLLLSYDKLVAPSFRCLSEEDGTLTLHYYSTRCGLHDLVKGVLSAVGREIFHQNVRLERVSTETNDLGEGQSQEHTIFTVYFLDEVKDRDCKEVARVQHKEAPAHKALAKRLALPGDLFCETFAYHVIFDENLVIRQVGDTLARMLSLLPHHRPHKQRRNPTTQGDYDDDGYPKLRMSEVFRVRYPRIILSLENILHFTNTIFVLSMIPRDDSRESSVSLKGQMRWLEDQGLMLFIGSPIIKSLKEMKKLDVFMADIPLYDVTREIVLLYEQRNAEIDITKQLDLTTAQLQMTSRALEKERRKTEQLLHKMLPPKVARDLMNGHKVEAETFEQATIMFSDVVTFTNIAAACVPSQIVDMLNDMYARFDNATTCHDVYKVETIGDAYMVVSGVPERVKNHSHLVARFSMDIVGQAALVLSPATGNPLQIRVGIHTGPVMAGVVGVKMPRYCLFGDTVNAASRMESHGVPGRIHLSPHAFRSLQGAGFLFKRRGEMDIKGKGTMVTYFLTGDGVRTVEEPQDAFTGLPVFSDNDPGHPGGDHADACDKQLRSKNGTGAVSDDGKVGDVQPATEAATPANVAETVTTSTPTIVVPDYSFLSSTEAESGDGKGLVEPPNKSAERKMNASKTCNVL